MESSSSVTRRPFVGFIIFLMAGLLVGKFYGNAILIVASLILAIPYWFWLRHNQIAKLSSLTVWAIVFLAGLLATSVVRKHAESETCKLVSDVVLPLKVCGVIDGDIKKRNLADGGSSYFFSLRNVKIYGAPKDGWKVQHMPVTLRWYTRRKCGREPRQGEKWQFTVSKIGRVMRFGKLRVTFQSREIDSEYIAPPSLLDWRFHSHNLRQIVARRLELGIEGWQNVPELIQAMLLGSRAEISPALNRVFKDSGTVHIFAISGMHIALVASVLIFILGSTGLARPQWGLILGPMLFAYAIFTGARPSALRACLMGTIYFFAPLIGRKSDGLSALSLTAIILLAFDPGQLVDLGFLFSFTIVCGLFLLCKPFSGFFKKIFGVNRMILESQAISLDKQIGSKKYGSLWIRYRYKIVSWIADLIAVSLAAWVTSIPLTALFFGRFVPGSLLANMVIVPTFFMVVVAAILSLLLGIFSDFFAITFNHAAAVLTTCMIKVAHITAHIPGLSMEVASPPLWGVVIWYLFMLLFAWVLARRQQTRSLNNNAW